jgi:hypothetical protein
LSDKLEKMVNLMRKKWVLEFQLQHSTDVPWTSYQKTFQESKITLISTTGVYVKGGGSMKYTCPCCGYKTLDEEPTDTYQICKICFWEDDGVQYRDPDYEGGANDVSLRQAQRNFIKFGACQEDCIT